MKFHRCKVLTPKYKCDITILFGCKRPPIMTTHHLELGDISDYIHAARTHYPDCEAVKIVVNTAAPVWEQCPFFTVP